MNKHLSCPRCDGHGFINVTYSDGNPGTATSYICPDCNGSGSVVAPMTHFDVFKNLNEEQLAKFNVRCEMIKEAQWNAIGNFSYDAWLEIFKTTDGSVFRSWHEAVSYELDWLKQVYDDTDNGIFDSCFT